jgi:hypothetical protein
MLFQASVCGSDINMGQANLEKLGKLGDGKEVGVATEPESSTCS